MVSANYRHTCTVHCTPSLSTVPTAYLFQLLDFALCFALFLNITNENVTTVILLYSHVNVTFIATLNG